MWYCYGNFSNIKWIFTNKIPIKHNKGNLKQPCNLKQYLSSSDETNKNTVWIHIMGLGKGGFVFGHTTSYLYEHQIGVVGFWTFLSACQK